MTPLELWKEYWGVIAFVAFIIVLKFYGYYKEKKRKVMPEPPVPQQRMAKYPETPGNVYSNLVSYDSQRDAIVAEIAKLQKTGREYRERLDNIEYRHEKERQMLEQDFQNQEKVLREKLSIGKARFDAKVRQLESIEDMITLQREFDKVDRKNGIR